MSDQTAKKAKGRDPDLLVSYLCGWAALALFIALLHRLMMVQEIRDIWVIRGAIFLVALTGTWIWGYWPFLFRGFRRWIGRGGLNAAIVILALMAGTVMLNVLAARQHWQWDLTQNQRFTLSDRTLQVLATLPEEVEVLAFFPAFRRADEGQREREAARDLLETYAARSERFRFALLDPDLDRQEYMQSGLTSLSGAVVRMGEREERAFDLDERELTRVLIMLGRAGERERQVGFLTGYGGLGPWSPQPESLQAVGHRLEGVGWQIEELGLADPEAPAPDPETVPVIVIARPEREPGETVLNKLNEYLENGGGLVVMLEAGGPGMHAFLREWGVEVGNDVVLHRARGEPLALVYAAERGNDIGRGIELTVHQMTRTVQPAADASPELLVTPLLRTEPEVTLVAPDGSEEAAEVPERRGESATIAVAVEKSLGEDEERERRARLVVFGGTVFATDLMAAYPDLYNLNLIGNAINWAGQDDVMVSIEPREGLGERVFLSPEQQRLAVMLHLLDFPLLALILGIFVYLRRR